MYTTLRSLRSRAGQVHRDIARQLDQVSLPQRKALDDLLARIGRILAQQRKDENKLYALLAPEVECIAMGSCRTP